jgi:subfamily B ATP-binding cassette protein MsbA
VFALIFLPLCFYPMVVLGRKARQASKAGLDTAVSQSSQLVELLASIRIIKAFGLEEAQLRRFRQSSRQLVRFGMKGLQAKEQINPFIEFTSTLGLGVLIVYIFHTHRQVPDLVGFLTGVVLFYVSIKKLMGIHIVFEQASVSVNRLIDVFRQDPTVKEAPSPKAFPRFASEIAFENVSFSYGPKPVLHTINLSIGRGFKLGIAGESGSGKSTLVNLLFRFYDPTAGEISIDGVDIRQLSVADLRRQMALVSQEVVVFDQSVAENIACGKLGATREEVEAAARHASAHEFITPLPQGYDTRLGERGVTLSGGQRQRIAIARAFIRNAPILVLDEATAALDSQAEAEVQAAIDRLAEHRTVICVAHRLSTLAAMDQIVVLSEGRIAECGTFSQLLQKGGLFAAMAQKQGIS